jgi:putative nucleotidyltransferase with HDIG domain
LSDSFKAVDIQTFRNTTRDINFDVYLKISDDNMAHVFSRTTGLDYKRLAQYIHKGVKELYIRNEDAKAYEEFVARTADSIFNDPNTSQEKKIATLLNMTEQNMAEVFTEMNISEETAANSQKVIKNYVDLMINTPKTLAIILKLVSHGEYLYYHSIAVSIFSMFIAKASGQFNQRMLEIVGLGGFLHDIGSTKLPKDLICSPMELTSAQWKEMRNHPKLGLSMIENTPNIPDEVRYIVYQHHEEPGGHGYPNGLHGPVIYYPAKIVALADAFSALISKRPFRPAYTVEQAIHILQSETGKYDRELVRMLSAIFLRQAVEGGGAPGGRKAA